MEKEKNSRSKRVYIFGIRVTEKWRSGSTD